MTRFILVRHGETAWNREARIQGQQDSALSPEGVAQARAVGARLKHEQASHLVSSDLGRTLDTAAAVALATGLEVEAHAGLRERAFGIFEGLTLAEIERTLPEEHARWRRREPDYAIPGGESLAQLRERVRVCLQGLAARGHDSMIVVTHGGVLDAAYRIAAGVPDEAPRDWPLKNASLNVIEIGPAGWRLGAWGVVDHIERAADDND